MISNLENGYTEDGSEAFPNEFYQSSESTQPFNY